LWEQPDVGGAGHPFDSTIIDVDPPGKRCQQRRLADTIWTNQSNAVARREREVDLVEDDQRTTEDSQGAGDE
jgi:hypothetical protein